MLPTTTSVIHDNQQPNETMTACLHRMRDADETMTHEARDQLITANAPAAPAVPATPSPTQPDPEPIHEEAKAVIDLNTLTVAELKQYASDNNIDLNGARNKPDILAALSV